MKCPECGSSDVGPPDDLYYDAVGVLVCEQCEFADLADGFEEDGEEG
ncbi:hypothetical protein ABIC89_000809 [Variovorax boronicumulans]